MSNKLLIKNLFRESKETLTEANYEKTRMIVEETWNKIFENIPGDIKTKNVYLFGKSYTFKSIMKFISICRYRIGLNDDDIFEAIKNVNWKMELDYWRKYNATTSKKGKITFGSSGGHGEVAVFDALMDCLPDKKEVKDAVQKYENRGNDNSDVPDGQESLDLD